MIAEAPSSPGEHRRGLHDDEHVAPTHPMAGEPGPEDAIGRPDLRSWGGSLVDSELVSEGEDLYLEGDARPEKISNEVE